MGSNSALAFAVLALSELAIILTLSLNPSKETEGSFFCSCHPGYNGNADQYESYPKEEFIQHFMKMMPVHNTHENIEEKAKKVEEIITDAASQTEKVLKPIRKKRMRQIKKMVQRGLIDPEKDDPFELFISATDISYCYYRETQRVLGNTFGMLVLQDFEAVTPNVLARTIETVEGGGLVVLLLKSMASLRQL